MKEIQQEKESARNSFRHCSDYNKLDVEGLKRVGDMGQKHFVILVESLFTSEEDHVTPRR